MCVQTPNYSNLIWCKTHSHFISLKNSDFTQKWRKNWNLTQTKKPGSHSHSRIWEGLISDLIFGHQDRVSFNKFNRRSSILKKWRIRFFIWPELGIDFSQPAWTGALFLLHYNQVCSILLYFYHVLWGVLRILYDCSLVTKLF